jgi:hypothetical protein
MTLWLISILCDNSDESNHISGKNEYVFLRATRRLEKTGTIKDYGSEEKEINRKRNKIIGLR